ncbi:MAG: hypothetical protein M4579_007019 [Chaenotheca gracillima]|nr:MAG: hypothetical protein M4579_007019 [Chaenotheca gracillima]
MSRRMVLERLAGRNSDIDIYTAQSEVKRRRTNKFRDEAEQSAEPNAEESAYSIRPVADSWDLEPLVFHDSPSLLDSNALTDNIAAQLDIENDNAATDNEDIPRQPADAIAVLQDALQDIPTTTDPVVADPPETEFVQDLLDNAEIAAVDEEESMQPPSRRPSATLPPDASEAIPHHRSATTSDDFEMSLGLWCEVTGISRTDYVGLLEILSSVKHLSEITRLPRTLGTLKTRVKASLPLMKLRKQEIPLLPEKVPTHSALSASLIWFDPVCLFVTILSSPSFYKQLHQGMAEFVDVPKELWHSQSWSSSIRASNGTFACLENGEPVFPSDIVIFTCVEDSCFCRREDPVGEHLGQVYSVGRDYTSKGFAGRIAPGQIALKIRPLLTASQLWTTMSISVDPPALENELFLVEDDHHFVAQEQLVRREESVILNYHFDTAQDGPQAQAKVIIQRLVNRESYTVRALNLSSPCRGQLELETFGRTHFVQMMGKKCVTVPFLCFIDGFGLYRNMYRSLIGLYLIFAGLNSRERFRRANVFPVTLGPHGSNFRNVVKALQQFTVLDEGVDVELNGSTVHLTAYTLAFIGDMPQQQENSGFMGPRATRSCRFCLVAREERGDLSFDIVNKGRYHHQSVRLRREGDKINAKTKRASYFQKLGMTSNPPPLASISPALDLIQSRPSDPAHSEYLGLSEPAHELLLTAILTEKGRIAYNEVLRSFPFPPGWARLQSPLRHFKSYTIQEHARASIIVPILLRCWLKETVIRTDYEGTIKRVFRESAPESSAPDLIVRCFGAMARSNSVLMSQSLTTDLRQRLPTIILDGRKSYQKLFEAAALACEAPRTRRRSASAASRSPSPASQAPLTQDTPSQAGMMSSFASAADDSSDTGAPVEGGKKAQDYRSSKQRPNIHAGLHYPSIVEEFGTSFNCNVLMGEDKHRFFKKIIYQSNHKNPEKMLLGRECLQQTIRFLLAGSHTLTEPDLTSQMRRLHQACPNVFRSILPPSEYMWEDADESSIPLFADNEHLDPAAQGCISMKFARETLGLPIRMTLDNISDTFARSLIQAYALDYNMPFAVELGRLPLQWCKKLSFTDRASQKRLTFKTGDFIRYRGDQIGRIDFSFIHEIVRGDRRILLWISEVEAETLEKDRVLELPLLRMKGSQIIVGLPAVVGKKIYIVPWEEQVGARDYGNSLLHCTWEIEFL